MRLHTQTWTNRERAVVAILRPGGGEQEVGVIEQVVKLGAKLKSPALTHRPGLEQGCIPILDARPIQGIQPNIAKRPKLRILECFRVIRFEQRSAVFYFDGLCYFACLRRHIKALLLLHIHAIGPSSAFLKPLAVTATR